MMNKYFYGQHEVNWKTVCYNRAWLGHRDEMQKLAAKLAYPFFAWNGRIYTTLEQKDTGFTVAKLDGE
jgi:hypothetical protein